MLHVSCQLFFLNILLFSILFLCSPSKFKRLFINIITHFLPGFNKNTKSCEALSIRPDLLSPRAMVELQKLCDKVQQGIGNRRGSMAVVNVGEEMMKHVKMSGDIISNFFKNSFAHRKKQASKMTGLLLR